MSWNPNRADDCVFGMEWLPERQADRPVGGSGPGSYSWTVDSTVTESVDRLWVYSGQAVPNAYDTIDIYDVDDVEPVVVENDTYIVTGDGGSARFIRETGAAWTGTYSGGTNTVTVVDEVRMGSTAGNLNRDWYTLVDDTTFTSAPFQGYYSALLTPPFLDPVQVLNREFIGLVPWNRTYYASGGDYVSQFSQWPFLVDNLETGLSGRRILGLTVSCVAQRLIDPRALSSEFDKPVRIRPALYVGGSVVWGQASIMPAQPQTISYTWFANPATGLPWTTTDLQAFDSTNEVLWLMSRPNDPEVIDVVGGAIYQVSATVTHCEETRVASARRANAQQVFGWNEWDVTAIGGGSWSKVSTDTYLMNARLDEQQAVDWRPTLSNEGLSVRALGDGSGDPNGFAEVQPEFIGGVPRNVGEATGWAPSVVLQRTDDDYSVDSQPYSVLRDFYGLDIVRDPGQTVLYQLLDVDVDPDRVRFVARSESASVPENNLIVYVADALGVEVAKSPVVTPAMLEQPGAWQVFDLPLTVTGAWATPDVYVALFVVDGDGTGWQILTVTDGSEEPGAAQADALYPRPALEVGFADTGSSLPLVPYGGDPAAFRNDGTVGVALGVEPVAPTGLTATAYTFGDTLPAPLVSPAVPSVVLEWDGQDGTEDCSDVAYYEVQRRSTLDDTITDGINSGWQTIFRVEVDGTETTYTAVDVECVRYSSATAANDYRIRLVATTGFVSDWSATASTAPDSEDYCGYVFATNELPQASLWFMDVGERSYGMLETVRYFEFEGRDGALPVRSLTDRLDEFDVQLMVGADGALGNLPDIAGFDTRGRARFVDLSVLAGNKLPPDATLVAPFDRPLRFPYLAVLDNRGNRWFASVETPTGTEQEPGGRHFYRVDVREVTKQPAVVTLVDSGSGVLVSEFVAEVIAGSVTPSDPAFPTVPGS